ncbi:MAG: TnpV protein [Clostridia bacterium]|nr:TnpV protein [Clostridia bacterium]
MSNTLHGDYYLPYVALSPEETNITLGKFGMMHKTHLEKFKPV